MSIRYSSFDLANLQEAVGYWATYIFQARMRRDNTQGVTLGDIGNQTIEPVFIQLSG